MAKRNPAQLPLPEARPITAVELMALETSRDTLVMLRKRVKEAEASLEAMEKGVMDRLSAGAAVVGPLTAIVETREGNCSPAWKDTYLAHMLEHGVAPKEAEEAIRAKTARASKRVLVIGMKPETVV